jgi:hypothetical protein
MSIVRLLALVSFLATVLPQAATAQEFRIYTRVMLLSAAPPRAEGPEIVARSVTLFHAGQVYDYIDEAGEVIVLEPAHRRYTILNLRRDLMTTLDFDELNNLLKVGRSEVESTAARLEEGGRPAVQKSARMLRFQLDPQFQEQFDAERRTLSLTSPMIRYVASCSSDPAPEVVDAWTKYADAMCRLNFVLHPSVLLPEPRLALNTALSKRRLVPTAVELQVEAESPLRLRAEHEIHWDLNAKDRSLIHDWESALKRKGTKQVTLQEYQRLVAEPQVARQK